jgi:hypothetical protein
MKSLSALIVRQKVACLCASVSNRFANWRIARTLTHVKLRLVAAAFQGTALRNPSPWRQSGFTIHLLPPFLLGALAKCNFERELLCQKQLSLSLPSLCQFPSQPVLRLIVKRNKLQAAQRLVHPQQPLLVETQAKSSQAASLAPLLVRLSQQINLTFALCGLWAALSNPHSKRRFAPYGQSGVLRF